MSFDTAQRWPYSVIMRYLIISLSVTYKYIAFIQNHFRCPIFLNIPFSPWDLHLKYYAQKESNSECVGPGTGLAKLSNDSTLNVTIEYRYSLVPNHRNTLSCGFSTLLSHPYFS